MVDSTACTLFNWDSTKTMDILQEKNALSLEGDTSIDTKQSYLNFYLGSSGESETTKSSPSDTSSKSPKSEITLNALQHEQNNLIQQRIHDRTASLRNMSNPLTITWPSYNNYSRPFSNMMMNTPGTTPGGAACLSTNPISACMFNANRTVQWFNRTNVSNDPWSVDYTQDPTMRSRPCFSSHQTRELEREFLVCQYVTRRRRIELAYTLNLTEKQIKTWFQNRRVKERKQKKTGEMTDISQAS